jgi:hypothetical protein
MVKRCKYPKCNEELGPSNKKLLCRKHCRYTNSCSKCEKLCYEKRKYCFRCSHAFKTWRSSVVVQCQYGSCSIIVNGKSRLCAEHFKDYWNCESPGCKEKCRYTSKYRLCHTHRGMYRKLKREGIEAYKVEPVPVKKRRLPKKARPAGRSVNDSTYKNT